MRRNTRLVVMAIVSPLLVATVTGVALAKSIQCKPNTKCEGTRKADFLLGTPKPDRIFGLGGADFLLGQGRGDKLVGGKGADNLEGGTGDQANDTLNGEKGQDLYSFRDNWGQDVIVDEAIVDRDPLTGNDMIIFDAAGPMTVDLNSDSGAEPEVSDGTNTVNWNGNLVDGAYVRTLTSDNITGNGRANFFDTFENGPGGNDTVTGGEGGDLFENADESGADNLSGDGGDDEIRNFDLTGNDTVDGGEGNDQLVSEGYDANEDNVVDPDTEDGGDDTVNGGEGDDTIDVQDEVGGDTVNCGGGTDTVAFDAGDTINADCENQ